MEAFPPWITPSRSGVQIWKDCGSHHTLIYIRNSADVEGLWGIVEATVTLILKHPPSYIRNTKKEKAISINLRKVGSKILF
jgi:hypothetical protein